MKERVKRYLELTDQLKQIKEEMKIIEAEMLKDMKVQGVENITTEELFVSISYKSKYDYDKETIYKILGPKNLFLNVVSIKYKEFKEALENKTMVSLEETRILLDAFKILETSEAIKVKVL